MVQPIDISVLVSQLPHLQKLHHAEKAHPEIMQSHLSKEALEQQIRERNLVRRTEKSESPTKVKPDEREKREQPHHHLRERDQTDQDQETEEDSRSAGPGHIIDISV